MAVALSAKDATKVDRSAGYMARYIAKNIVASELADECLVQLAYCIGSGRSGPFPGNNLISTARVNDQIQSWRPLYERCFLYRRKK